LAELGIAETHAGRADFGMEQFAQAFEFGNQVWISAIEAGDALDINDVERCDGDLGARLVEPRFGAGIFSVRVVTFLRDPHVRVGASTGRPRTTEGHT